MKPFKSKDFRPDEEVEDLYGPPEMFGLPDERTDESDDAAPEFIDEEQERLRQLRDTQVQLAYGPPVTMTPDLLKDQEVQPVYGPPEWFSNTPDGFFSTAPEIPPVLRGDAMNGMTVPGFDRLMKCYHQLRAKTDFVPKVALVLGSGLGGFADEEVDITCTVDYSEIEGFPRSTVLGHRGRFVFGFVGDVPVVVMQGRVHYYEGYSMTDVVMPARLMSMLGAEVLFLTNASGGINADFSAGDFMLIKDHISTFVPNPLIGQNMEQLGTRFPDMSRIYSEELNGIIRSTASELNISLKEGVYVQLTGPSFESPAEIRMLRGLGADAVGMSTAVEAIAANHAGMKICGISCVANLACGMTDNPLTHAEVQECADKAAPKFKALIGGAIRKMGKIGG